MMREHGYIICGYNEDNEVYYYSYGNNGWDWDRCINHVSIWESYGQAKEVISLIKTNIHIKTIWIEELISVEVAK